MRPSILLVPLLVACEGGIIGQDTGDTADTGSDTADTADTADTSGDTGDTATTGCTATVSYQSPRDDETNVAVSKIITVRFSAAVDASEWAIAVDGVTGTAALAQNGLSATFTPSAEFATDTDYTLRTTVCGATSITQFRTASGPLDATTLEGRSYAVAYGDIVWVEPAAASQLIGFIGQPFEYMLLHVDDIDETYETITTTVAPGVTDNSAIVQDPCGAPTTFDPADFSGNPVVEVGPADLTFDAGGTPVTVKSAYFKSVFVENGAAIEGIDIEGQLDAAAMTASLGFDLCSFGSYVGLTCVACYDAPSSVSCLNVHLTADRAEWVEGLVFDPALDPSQNAACN